MKNSEVENIITYFVKRENAFEVFLDLAYRNEDIGIHSSMLAPLYKALDLQKTKDIELVFSHFTKYLYLRHSQSDKQIGFQEYWLKFYDLLMLEQAKHSILSNDYYFSKVKFLIGMISQKPPNNLFDVCIVLLDKLLGAYDQKSKNYQVIYIIYRLEALIEYIWGIESLLFDKRFIYRLSAICYLKIEDDSNITYGFLKKALSILAAFGTDESMKVVRGFLDHKDLGVQKEASRLLEA